MASGFGQSLDLSAGTFATVSTGGTEDVFDGDNNFFHIHVDEGMARRCEPVDPFKKKQRPNPEGISTKLWLDASDTGSFVLPNETPNHGFPHGDANITSTVCSLST